MQRIRSRIVIVCACLAVAIGTPLSIAALRARRSAPARYELDRTSFNWGNVEPGSHVSTVFIIRNSGCAPLELGEATTSCGCTKPSLPDGPIEPGGRRSIDVKFQVPATLGTVRHFVKIPTTSQGQPPIELTLFATAWCAIRTVPQAVDIGHLRPGDHFERVIQVYSADSKPFRINWATVDLDSMTVDRPPKDRSLPMHRIVLRYDAGNGLGHIQGTLRVGTDREDCCLLSIPLAGQTVGSVTASPSLLQIPMDQIGAPVKRTLILSPGSAGTELRLSRLEVRPPWRLIESSTRTVRGGRLAIELTVQVLKTEGSLLGVLVLHMFSPRGASISVPLTVPGWAPPLPVESHASTRP